MVIEDICKNCYKKLTTDGCVNSRLKTPINELNEFIESHKSNLSHFILYVNADFYADIEKCLNLNLEQNLEVRITPMLKPDEIGVIVDKKLLDWGNISIN